MAPLIIKSFLLWLWSSLTIPDWETLEATVLPRRTALIFSETETIPQDLVRELPIFYRDRKGICPLVQQVWLGLEVKNANYITVLVDSTSSDPASSWSACSPVMIQWPDGSVQTHVKDILERINIEYPEGIELYPGISKAVDSVRCNIVRFDGVFPRKTQENIYAPYLIRQTSNDDSSSFSYSWVPESDHMVTLEEIDEVMEEYFTGPFLCGNQITAADIMWAPFLDRYAAQLPMIYEGGALTPRSNEYETLQEWYQAMEELIPCYSCRVMGDQQTWQRVLQGGLEKKTIAIPDVELLPIRRSAIHLNRPSFNADKVWEEYRTGRPYLCNTPQQECVAFYVRNRDTIIPQAAQAMINMNNDEIGQALLEILGAILEGGDEEVVSKLSGNARELAFHLDEQLRVPRDMGALPAAALRRLVAVAPKPRISSR